MVNYSKEYKDIIIKSINITRDAYLSRPES